MRTGVLVSVCFTASSIVFSGMLGSGCKGAQVTYSPDASLAGAAGETATGSGGSGNGGACNVPTNSNSAPIGSCLSAAKFVDCTLDGGGVGCLSNNANTCTGYEGAVCVSKCASNQYAVACGGPPAAGGVTYEPVPSNCTVVAVTPSGKSYACCSCDGAQ